MDVPPIKCEPLAVTGAEEGGELCTELDISYQHIKTECLEDSAAIGLFAGIFAHFETGRTPPA